MTFLDSLDIANRACQILGVRRIESVSEDSRQNTELAMAYDRLLDTELQRNYWTFAIKRVAIRAVTPTTVLIQPQVWDAEQLYLPGAIVADSNGELWTSVEPENLGNDPTLSNAWDQYFGPLTADAYDTTGATQYYTGELVYLPIGSQSGGYALFMALANGTTEAPLSTDAWSSTTTYGMDDVVSYGGSQWRSIIALNLNITPADAPLAYNPSTTYASGNQVVASDGFIYTSLSGSNTGNDPTLDDGVNWNLTGTAAWSRSPAIYPTSTQWTPLFAAMTNLRIYSPIGAGPIYSGQTFRNLYHLPANHLSRAPQAPKQGSLPVLGGPTNATYPDWEFDGDYIVTSATSPLIYRFVASIRDVEKMHPMFCEGMAARMALDTCEILTEDTSKWQMAGQKYKLAIDDARTKNAIEQGPDEPYEDEFVSVRM